MPYCVSSASNFASVPFAGETDIAGQIFSILHDTQCVCRGVGTLNMQLCIYTYFVSNAAEISVTPGCDTLNVSYTVNSIPGGGNEATLRSLVVRYQAILGFGSSGTKTVALNGRAAMGVLSLSGLTRNTLYRVTHSVVVNVSFQVTLPSDIPDPVEVFTTRACTGQCSTQLQHVFMWKVFTVTFMLTQI